MHCIDRIKHRLYKMYSHLKEKSKNILGVKIKYLFYSSKESEVLLIGLSACAKQAQYNYVKTLSSYKINKLFIKDDFTDNKRGCYYLNGDNSRVEDATIELIKQFIVKINPQKVVFIGSSKGGYSALNLGLHFYNSYIIIGSPQYFLYDYLSKSEMNSQIDFLLSGRYGFDSSETLNEYLRKNLSEMHKNIKRLYLHYSDSEHTYTEHISYLLDDIESYEIELIKDIMHYTEHNDVAYHYPEFLKTSLNQVINER